MQHTKRGGEGKDRDKQKNTMRLDVRSSMLHSLKCYEQGPELFMMKIHTCCSLSALKRESTVAPS